MYRILKTYYQKFVKHISVYFDVDYMLNDNSFEYIRLKKLLLNVVSPLQLLKCCFSLTQ